MKPAALLSFALWTVVFAALPAVARAQNYTLTTVRQLGAANDGANPNAGLTHGADGNFYGTTPVGGTTGLGTVYKLTGNGAVTILHSFTATEGMAPSSVFLAKDGNLYGTTSTTVFKLTPTGTLTALYTFGSHTLPNSLVQGSDGAFYGTTAGDSDYYTSGTAFRLTANGALTTLYTFPLHLNPTGLLESGAGVFYGTTHDNSQYGAGYNVHTETVFSLTSAGVPATLYTFDDNTSVTGPLTRAGDGFFYGSTRATVYKISPEGVLTFLHFFSSVDNGGYNLSGGALGSFTGAVYGVTTYGGAYGHGTVFALSPEGVLTTLHDFTGGADGGNPVGALLDGPDGLYGTTSQLGGTDPYSGPGNGNAPNAGTVFRASAGGGLTTLHAFAVSDPIHPSAGLIQARDGNLYGATSEGAANGFGGVFSLTPDGTLTTLYSAPYQDAGFRYGLIQGADGNFYGSTGYYVVKLTPDGTLTNLTSVGAGYYTRAGVIQGRDGNFYGTTDNTIFMATPAGLLTQLHSFTASEGGGPNGGVIQGADGNFYGTTPTTVFKFTPDGVVTTLATFRIGDGDGARGLFQGAGGVFYGAYYHGDDISVYSITPEGKLTTLSTVEDNGNGSTLTDLIVGNDGQMYGTSAVGGANRQGYVFQLTPEGTQTILYSFTGGSDGAGPTGLLQASDGSFYGTAAAGGVNGNGTIFKLAKAPTPVITLNPTAPQVTTGSGQAGVVLLTLPAVQTKDVVVNYTVKGSAVPGVDYVALKGHAKIKAGKLSKPIKIVPLGDLGGAAKKTVKITFTPGDGYDLGTTAPIKIKILAGGQ